MTPSASTHPYKHHRFPGEMLSYAVWLYVRLCLSQRDVETGSVTDSCAMTPVAERSACQSGYSKEGSPWDTSHKLYGYSTGCEAEPTSQHDDPRQAWAVIDANDTYQHSKQNLENLRRNCYAPIRQGSPCVTSETNVMRPQGAKRCAPSKATFPSMRSPL